MRAMFLLALLVVAPPDRPDPTPKQTVRPLHEDILGEWQVIRHETGGNDDKRNNLIWAFTKDTMQHVYNESSGKRIGGSFPYTLDTSKSPAVIVFPNSKFAGILRVEGEMMTVCLHGDPNNQPPREFASPPGTRITLLQLSRVKK
jgi:uncharacterized protein (TIGR03067 family)